MIVLWVYDWNYIAEKNLTKLTIIDDNICIRYAYLAVYGYSLVDVMTSDYTNLPSVEGYYKKSHAIIIGISKYKEETPLLNALNDATAIKKVLEEKYGFNNVITLFNEEATGEKIREILQDILRDESTIGTQDRVLIYYSGHGKLRRNINWKGEEINTGYIIPYDSRLKRYGSSIEMDDLVRSCQGCNAKHILLILDCCYSGYAATRNAEPKVPSESIDENFLHDITQRKAIQVLAATQKDEPANDSGILPGFSAFTGALLEILKNEKDPIENGIITASEIGAVLQQEVVNQKGVFQRPSYNVIAGSEGGDFIFKVLPTALKKPPVANAGVDQVVDAGTPVTLDATKSKDSEGKPLKYSWIQIGGTPIVVLGHANTPTPTFTAPMVSEDTTFTFKLSVTDESGVSSYDDVKVIVKYQIDKSKKLKPLSFSSKILLPIVVAIAVIAAVIFIRLIPDINDLPIANAGLDQTVNAGDTVTLDGSKSKDSDGNIDFISWKQIAGPNVELNDRNSMKPSFTAPSVTSDTTLTFGLTVKDDKGATSTNHTSVDVIKSKILPSPPIPTAVNNPPIANDNQAITTSMNQPVNIQLSASDKDNDELTGDIVSTPLHGALSEINQETGELTYTPNHGFTGTDNFTFKVNDGKVDSCNTGTIKVTVNRPQQPQLSPSSTPITNHPPTALDQSVTTNMDTPIDITLGANDQDQNDELTAQIISPPSNGILTEIDQATGMLTYTPNPGFTGADEFTFKVNDGKVDSNNTGTVSIIEQKYSFVGEWGFEGKENGNFSKPQGIAIDSAGCVYVADASNNPSNNRIQKFTANGTFVTKWGSQGSADGQFDWPQGIAIDSAGYVYVADALNKRIQKFTANGTFVTKWDSGGQFDWPEDIAIDSAGYVYVVDAPNNLSNNRIQKFTANGTFVTEWGSGGKENGNFSKLQGIAIDSAGYVYVADTHNHRIQKFTSDGTFITAWGSEGTENGEFKNPFDVAIDSSGNVYVDERGNNRVQKFTSDGKFITKWGSQGSAKGQFNNPSGIDVDSSGNVYVGDRDNNRIQVFAPSM